MKNKYTDNRIRADQKKYKFWAWQMSEMRDTFKEKQVIAVPDTDRSVTVYKDVLMLASPGPPLCHQYGTSYIPKANTNSSKRVKAAYMSTSNANWTKSKRRRQRNKHSVRNTKLQPTSTAPSSLRQMYEPNSKIVTVFDGSHGPIPTTKRPFEVEPENWNSISISSGGLHIVEPSYSMKGVHYPLPLYNNPNNCPTPFIMPPRSEVLMKLGLKDEDYTRDLFKSAQFVEKFQVRSTKRHILVLGDDHPEQKYVGGYGQTVNRNCTGISESAVYKKTPREIANVVNAHVEKMESISRMYVDVNSVNIAEATSNLMHHPTIGNCKIYSGLATGTNKYLPVHQDKDFTSSLVVVLKNQACKDEESIVAYFCFPELGVAVPLRPGNVLIFNPREPHCLSSRCNSGDKIVCMSLYLKTAVVGLNDNSMKLTRQQEILADSFGSDFVSIN